MNDTKMNIPLNHHLHSSQSHNTLRQWQSFGNNCHSTMDFILPLFIINNDDGEEPIHSMPGIKRMGINVTINYLRPLVTDLKLKSVLLFPVMDLNGKDIRQAFDDTHNPVLRLIPLLKQNFPDLLIITDVCLCTFSSDGHCCVFDNNGQMDNAQSVELIAGIALKYAQIGCHVIAPSDMMDGRIGVIKKALHRNGHDNVAILSYAAKFASCFYGPFRDAAESAPKFGDRKCYQLPSGSKGLALRAVARDIEEGADMIMVKPALPYIDLVSSVSNSYPNYPIAVYHVSGEYAMLCHGANGGAFDLRTAVMEVVTCFKRAGATMIITYFTPMILQWIKEEHNDVNGNKS